MSQEAAAKRLTNAFRRMGTASALHSQSVARRLGLASVDLECLDMIVLNGPVTAGKIAEHTKLTTGAVTGLIDRLQKKGFVERIDAPADRRKVLVQIVQENIKSISDLYLPMSKATKEMMKGYTAEELDLVAGFMEKSAEIGQRRAEELDKAY